MPNRLHRSQDIFDTIRKGDIVLHQPFQSFNAVVDLLRQAAEDPDVLVIKQTLYRTGNDSSVVDALIKAAHNGKEVTVVIELRARFDEEETSISPPSCRKPARMCRTAWWVTRPTQKCC